MFPCGQLVSLYYFLCTIPHRNMFGQTAAMLLPGVAERVGQQLLQAPDQQREQEGLEITSHAGFASAQHEGTGVGCSICGLFRF